MTIYEQLTEYCDCLVVESDEEGVEDSPKFDERDVDELIYLISSYTCWMQNPCETFLSAERTEIVDVKDCVSNDCDVIEFEPFYTPFETDSFVFTLIERNGINETLIPINTYRYSEAEEKFLLELPLPSCSCRPVCGCQSTYKLKVEYTAGYEEIPDCLLPIFCEALQWIIEKNQCDCEKCQSCDNKYDVNNEIDYTTMTGRLKEYFLNILTRQYFKQLSLISLCRLKTELWSVVV